MLPSLPRAFEFDKYTNSAMGNDGIVFIPGMMCDERLFEPQIAALGVEHTIEVVLPCEDETVEAAARRVLETTPFRFFSVVGLSLGGIIAMEMLRQEPARIERVALLDTNHLADSPERIAQRLSQVERVKRGQLHQVMMQEQKPFYVAPKNMGDPDLNATFMNMAEDLGPDVFIRQSKMLMARKDAIQPLKEYKRPSLLLCGEHDKPCPVSLHGQMKSLLDNSELIVVPDAGHISTLENPNVVTSALRWWLKAEL